MLLRLYVTCEGGTADSRDNLNALVKSRPGLEMLKIHFFVCICEAGPVWTSTGSNLMVTRESLQGCGGGWFSVPGMVQKGVSSVPAPALKPLL